MVVDISCLIENFGGLGPALSIFGLVLDFIGVIMCLLPLIAMPNDFMEYVATRTDNIVYGPDEYNVENSKVYKNMKGQRFTARVGLCLLFVGFALQIIGTYIWAKQ